VLGDDLQELSELNFLRRNMEVTAMRFKRVREENK